MDTEFLNKQRHDLALAWATAVFNKNHASAPVSPGEQVNSLSEFHELYIFAFREYSNYCNSEFDSVPPEPENK